MEFVLLVVWKSRTVMTNWCVKHLNVQSSVDFNIPSPPPMQPKAYCNYYKLKFNRYFKRILITLTILINFLFVFANEAQAPGYIWKIQKSKSDISRSTKSKFIQVIATAYTPYDDSQSGITATGIKADYGIIAVDPSFIKLGTRVYIPDYGFAIAADTGGMIKGNHIDVCIPDKQKALEWGVRKITIEVL